MRNAVSVLVSTRWGRGWACGGDGKTWLPEAAAGPCMGLQDRGPIRRAAQVTHLSAGLRSSETDTARVSPPPPGARGGRTLLLSSKRAGRQSVVSVCQQTLVGGVSKAFI